MPTKDTTSELELLDDFLAALRAVPGVSAEYRSEVSAGSGGRYDARFDLCVAGKAVALVAEVKKSSYPRDVREAVWQLRALGRGASEASKALGPLPVVVAESISPGAKEILRKERVGYYDSGGSLFLPGRDLYIFVDKPPPKRLSRSIRSLFSGRRAQVLHALLLRHEDWFGVGDLAKAAAVSPATASQVLIELERFDWVAVRGRGPHKERLLKEPAALLDAWAKQLPASRPPVIQRYYVPLLQPEGLIEKIAVTFATQGIEYAISGEAAGQRYAPFLSSLSKVHCRVSPDRASQGGIRELGARAVDEGPNLIVIESRLPGELSFRRRMGGGLAGQPDSGLSRPACDRGPRQGNGGAPARGEDRFLMAKPQTHDGYAVGRTEACERVLVTLLRGLGPWKDSVYLIGGLTPRSLVPARPGVPAHAGTLDVDIVIDLEMLVRTDAYRTLEDNLRRMGFAPVRGKTWRWQTLSNDGGGVVLELLTDGPEKTGGLDRPLPAEGPVSALNIPHASIVFDQHEVAEIRAELLDGNGVATERVRFADVVSFTCLKAFAFDQRFERKDAHDLIYCIEHASEGLDAVCKSFREVRAGNHRKVVDAALRILRERFASDARTEGHRKDGPVAVAKFELGEDVKRDAQLLRQRQAADLVGYLLANID